MKRILTVLVASVLSAAAVADDVEKPYVGIDYLAGKFEQDSTKNANLEGVRIRLGSDILPHLGIEAQGALGTNKATVTLPPGYDYNVKLHGIYGLYLRPKWSTPSDSASVFLIGGYSVVGIDSKAANGVVTQASNGSTYGISYGAGVDFRVSKCLHVGIDYTQYVKTYKAFGIGIRIPVN